MKVTTPGVRVCNRCKTEKPLDDFEKAARYHQGRMPVCRECRREYRDELAARPKPEGVTTKVCTGCKVEQPITAFHKERRSKDGYNTRCTTCRKYAREQEDPRVNRDRFLRWKYGIGLEDYEKLLAAQDGVCAACKRTPGAHRVLDVDHSHDDGTVRGLLCSSCNTALGLLDEDVHRILALVKYLVDNSITEMKMEMETA